MRRSHEGLRGVIKDNYPSLPEELKEFNYFYYDGSGHVIMAVPECLLKEAEQNGDLDMFECPFPVKYVLENGWGCIKIMLSVTENMILDLDWILKKNGSKFK